MKYKEYLNNYKDTNKFRKAIIDRKINRISIMLDELLISSDGKCMWDNIDILKASGYYVGPGEQDRFGWVTGILGTKKGDIVFG